ncbi:MAG TPA: hypothetical protein PLN52_24430 [Opitutaceae bacterium]|nr:hypothetical protein [Opitutaceae bacterium]
MLTARLAVSGRRIAAIFFAMGSFLGPTWAASPQALVIDEVPLLFVDDGAIAASSGLSRTVHTARTRSEPVLIADKTWEGVRVYTYGSVVKDRATGQYRLWYMSRSQEPGPVPAPQLRVGGQDLVLYATSLDGVKWEKPALNLHAYRDSKANNIVADLHSPAVLLDPFERDPARRYKLLGYMKGRYYAMYSSDGLNWKPFQETPVFSANDTMSLTQNPRTGEFMAYVKKNSTTVPGRVVWLFRSRDFVTWTEPVLVFHADEEYNRWARHPDQRTEVYNMTVIPHAGGFIGLPTMFRVISRTPEGQPLPKGQSGNDGPIDVQFVTSNDGVKWERSHPRIHVIPRGAPGSFDGGLILGLTSGVVHDADTTWLLYTALNTGHGGAIPPKRNSIGRAEWRLHGFASLDATPSGGRLETKPLVVQGGSLIVNADASLGVLRVALRESDGRSLPGFTLEECEPLRTDATRHRVRWNSGQAVPSDRPLTVIVEMTSTRLFSLAGVGE